MATTNWVCEKQSVSEKELKALEKAKTQERKKIENGWKYYVITPRLKVLVPFEKGKPTADGVRMIDNIKKLVGIK
jgi:hypothetical protein